ncbi:hypothetical protein D6D24_06746 [Aureobasidium pullulans]|uniref:Uncharacterized protein n=1 Tax=Aureobasidium pullulans TaxID=5580 RepID=A0A4S8VM90_AURPU|nr:hypothetical protein D6D24_06746 [Aureobasidium pullulans]
MPTGTNNPWRAFPSIPINVGHDKSLGNAWFSEANVDCSFLQGRPTWGSIGNPPPQDVGLLYLKIFFCQPRDCRLRYVRVEIEVGPESETQPDQCPYIHVTHPGQLYGQPYEESVEKNVEVRPRVEGAGIAGEIGSYSQNTSFQNDHRWSFTLQKHPDKRDEYTKLIWGWDPPEKGASFGFERPIYAAVVVGHGKAPFTIRTRITGRLKSFRHGFENLMIGLAEGRDEGRKVTLTPDSSVSPMDLTTLIEELGQAVEANNRQQAPTEMPNFRQAV